MSKKPKRCKLIVDGVRCDLDATYRLFDETGRRVKGAFYCERHALQYVAAHHRWMGLTWTAEPQGGKLKAAIVAARGQSARIKELEATIGWAREHAVGAIEDYDYDPDDDMTCELALLLIERDEHIKELEAACAAALAWYGPDGDHISEPQRSQLRRALNMPDDSATGWLRPRIPANADLLWRSALDYYDEEATDDPDD